MLGGQKDKKPPALLAVTPPRTGERTLLGVENLLQSIAVPEPFSLELAGDADGVTLMARCRDDEVVKGQISAHYPQARIQDVPHEEDPLRLDEGEEAWSMTLAADGPDYLPLRTFRDDDLLDPGSDPLIALTGDEILRLYPVSARWQRILLERLDAIAVIYRLASAIANIAHPIRFRWYRAMPMDAAIVLADGRTVAVVRQGLTSDRTSFSKRLWRLREDVPRPSAVLILAPDEVRLRHARRLSIGTPTLLALERDAALCGTGDPIWHPPSINATLDLEYVLSRLEQGGPLPTEAEPSRVFLPGDIALEEPVQDLPGHLLPVLLRPGEKRVLDVLSDWPWITLKYLAGLLGVSAPRVSQLLIRLESLGLATRVPASGRRLALTGQGLSLLARRDRTSVGIAKRRWSADLLNPGLLAEWRNVSGTGTAQLLRNIEHTQAVHGFVAALARQSRTQGREVMQIDPPRRASRYFRYGERLHSVHPDAYGAIRRSNVMWPFFLEWERRAVRPTTMTARLAPYLRYYSTHSPTDDHGAQPAVLVVFDDDLTPAHFLRMAQEEMARPGSGCPCGSPTEACWSGWGRWKRPGALRRAGSRPMPSGTAEYQLPNRRVPCVCTTSTSLKDPATTSALPWGLMVRGGTSCSARSRPGGWSCGSGTASLLQESFTPATCWRDEDCWRRTARPTSG